MTRVIRVTYRRGRAKQGQRSLAEVLDAITETETRLDQLGDSPAVPAQPDRRRVDDWLHRSHLNYWASQVPSSERRDRQTGQRITSRPDPVP